MRVRGRVVVVTGASSGIGAACALAVARRQARAVVLLARTAAALEGVATEVRALGAEALPCPVDLTDPLAVEDAKATVERAMGVPDVLVNNAGAGRWLFVEETSPAEAVQMMAVPYFAAFFATRAFLPGMISRGSGHVVNVTSVAAYAPWPGATGYTAARWAMRGFTEALRADLRGTGVGVTLFSPGKVSSPYFDHNAGTEERIPRIARLYRTLTPEEAANALVRGIERGSREVVSPALMRLTIWLQRFWPGAVSSLVVRTGARRPADAEHAGEFCESDRPRLEALRDLKREEHLMSAAIRSSFVYVTVIRATPEKLWEALTDPKIIRRYWFDAIVECGWKKGSPWRKARGDGSLTDSGEILEIDPPRRMVIRWQGEWKPEFKAEGPSRCTFALEPMDGAVKLISTHEIERPESKFIAAVSEGWPLVISNLKSLLETGEGALETYPVHQDRGDALR